MDFSALNTAVLTTFGGAVSYQPMIGAAYALTVIWSQDKPAEQQNRAAAATAWARLADFSTDPQKGDEITKDGKVYKVSENPADGKDGAGGVTLVLRYVRDVL